MDAAAGARGAGGAATLERSLGSHRIMFQDWSIGLVRGCCLFLSLSLRSCPA
jgi:hypothetical protein